MPRRASPKMSCTRAATAVRRRHCRHRASLPQHSAYHAAVRKPEELYPPDDHCAAAAPPPSRLAASAQRLSRSGAPARRAARARRLLRGGGTAATAPCCLSTAPITPRHVSPKSCTRPATAAWRRHRRHHASRSQPRHSTSVNRNFSISVPRSEGLCVSTAAIANDQAPPGGSTSVTAASQVRAGRVDHACEEADPHPAHVAHLALHPTLLPVERARRVPATLGSSPSR